MAIITVEQVEHALGRELDEAEKDRCSHIIEHLSNKFCAEAGIDFTLKKYTHWVKVNSGQARIHYTPIVAVSEVTDTAGNPIEYRRHGNVLTVPLGSGEIVCVTYTAGYENPPADVVTQLIDSACRVMNISPEASRGYSQHSTTAGPYTESGTFATWAVGGQAMLSPEDVRLARTYRPKKYGNVWVSR